MKSLCPLLAFSVLGFPVACSDKNGNGGGDDSTPSTDDSAAAGLWEDMSREPSTADTFNAVYANGPQVWVAVSGGAVEVWDGSIWTRYDKDTKPPIVQGANSVENQDMKGIWGDGQGTIIAVGESGKIATWTGAGWLVEDIGSANLNSIDGVATANLMAGGWGGIYNNGTGDWEGPAAILGNPLMNHLWFNGKVGIAVGEKGARATFGGSAWTSNPDAELRKLYGVHALSLDDAWAVGERGLAFYYNGEDWAEFDTHTSASLWGVWMVSHDSVYAVGNNGTAVHWDGTDWSPLDTGGRSNLYGIYGVAENDVWACGASGALYHYVGATATE